VAQQKNLVYNKAIRYKIRVVFALTVVANHKKTSVFFFYNPQVLEWAGVSLANRSFEEVCGIIDRSGDVVELLVEQGYEL